MEKIPFLGLDEEVALANGPGSGEEAECDTHTEPAGQSEVTGVFNKQVVHSLKCTMPEFVYFFTHS